MTTIFENNSGCVIRLFVRSLLLGLFFTSIFGFCGDVCAQQQKSQENYNVATNSKQAYQLAVKRIPWKQLSKESQAKAKNVATDYTIFRRLPQQAVYCDPAMYEYCLLHPETVVAIWEHLGVTQVSVTVSGENTYTMKESTGTVAEIEVLYRSQNLCILYAQGTYLGPMIQKSIKGDVLLVLQSRFGTDKSGEPFLVARMEAFVRIHNPGAELIAKLLTPVVGKIVDNNFEQTVAFIGNVSDAAQSNPNTVIEIGKKLKGLQPEAQADFLQTVRNVYANAQILANIHEITAQHMQNVQMQSQENVRMAAQLPHQPYPPHSTQPVQLPQNMNEPAVMQKTFEPRTAAVVYSEKEAAEIQGESIANPAVYSQPKSQPQPQTYPQTNTNGQPQRLSPPQPNYR